jgi:hypothetical protein
LSDANIWVRLNSRRFNSAQYISPVRRNAAGACSYVRQNSGYVRQNVVGSSCSLFRTTPAIHRPTVWRR